MNGFDGAAGVYPGIAVYIGKADELILNSCQARASPYPIAGPLRQCGRSELRLHGSTLPGLLDHRCPRLMTSAAKGWPTLPRAGPVWGRGRFLSAWPPSSPISGATTARPAVSSANHTR